MAPNKPTVDFNAIVQAERRRRKNESVAQKMFDKARRQNTSRRGGGHHKHGTVPSLASRVSEIGISKRTHSASNRPRRSGGFGARSDNPEDDWTHDLHGLNNPSIGSSNSNGEDSRVRANLATRKLISENHLISSPTFQTQFNIVGNAKPTESLSIRGLAGPYTVIVKNLATGTTAADIESAMAPVGGLILSCRLISERPRVIAEVILETKEGADNIVETFNNQSADGNILHVYHKVGPFLNPSPRPPVLTRNLVAPSRPRADYINDQTEDSRSYAETDFNKSRGRNSYHYKDNNREDVMDGSYGFSDRMEIDDREDKYKRRGLYSDNLIGNRYGRRSRGDEGRGYR
ncbi:hypothetical protein HI914_00638 [Erysiphe necator]|uniref:Putative rna-rbd n=1 Tax=Uncinula necator TaxID=52586 RepID=A0A0B1P1J2_UNCNE|nr:hypothetical protein HI914_00638 [Erysiphe necator]KHJ32502.1 putative rna- rbd [Erysiphe necator]